MKGGGRAGKKEQLHVSHISYSFAKKYFFEKEILRLIAPNHTTKKKKMKNKK